MYKHILVPTDGSLLSARTIGSAVEFARGSGARITFLYVEPDHAADVYGEAALLHSMAPQQFVEKYHYKAKEILSKAEAVALGAQVQCNCISAVSNAPHEVIVEVAGQQGCDLIFMASRGKGGAAGMMIGSETLKTLMHASVPVLVSSVAANAPVSVRALSVIQEEHQAIAAVTRRLQSLAADARRAQVRPEVSILREIIAYFRDFPVKYHHPKEDDYLFELLGKRTHQVDKDIAELRRQHHDEGALLDVIKAEVDRLEADPASDLRAFCDAVDRFVVHTWGHLKLEEEVIFPAAREHLTNDDWLVIDAAFSRNGKEGFADAGARLLKSAFMRIVNVLDR